MKSELKQTIIFLLILSSISCSNIFAGGARKTTDAAKFLDAKIKVNARDWQGAIDLINSMSTKYQARRDVKFLLASAQGGLCGLDFIALAQRLSQQGGTSNLFQLLLDVFRGGANADVRRDACIEADVAINDISTDPLERDADENTLAAFIGIAKATAALAVGMDTDGNGVADAADPCTQIADADANQIITGMNMAYTSLQQVTTIGSAFVTAYGAMCATLGANDFCNVVDPAAATQSERQGARGMTKETTNGFGLKIGAGGAAANAPACGT